MLRFDYKGKLHRKLFVVLNQWAIKDIYWKSMEQNIIRNSTFSLKWLVEVNPIIRRTHCWAKSWSVIVHLKGTLFKKTSSWNVKYGNSACMWKWVVPILNYIAEILLSWALVSGHCTSIHSIIIITVFFQVYVAQFNLKNHWVSLP